MFIEDCILEGGYWGLLNSNSALAIVVNSEIRGCFGYGIFAADRSTLWMENNNVHGHLLSGVNVQAEGSLATLIDNKICSCRANGVMVCAQARVILENNVICDNGDAGVSVCDEGTQVVVRHNTVARNGLVGVYCFDGAAAVVEDNDLRGNLHLALSVHKVCTGGDRSRARKHRNAVPLQRFVSRQFSRSSANPPLRVLRSSNHSLLRWVHYCAHSCAGFSPVPHSGEGGMPSLLCRSLIARSVPVRVPLMPPPPAADRTPQSGCRRAETCPDPAVATAGVWAEGRNPPPRTFACAARGGSAGAESRVGPNRRRRSQGPTTGPICVVRRGPGPHRRLGP